MLRATLVSLGLVASALLFSELGSADGSRAALDRAPGRAGALPVGSDDAFFAATASKCDDRMPQSPVVLYSSAGGTLVGLEFDQITVYSDGLVLLAGAQSFTGTSSARMAHVPALAVLELGRDLARLGAATLCDQAYDVSDVPLKTISFASGMGSDVRLHSFSYWLPTDEHGLIESALEQWLLDNRVIGSPLD